MADVTIRISAPVVTLLAPVGHQEVLASGSLVAFTGETVEFAIQDGFYSFQLDVLFVEVPGQPTGMSSTLLNANRVRLTLTNFSVPTGSATTNKIPVAMLGPKQMYLTFAVYGIGTARVMHYMMSRDA
jgi:hypothetical protein